MKRQRGSTLMIGMTAVFGCMMIGISVVGLQSSETFKAQRVRKQAQAFALAEVGPWQLYGNRRSRQLKPYKPAEDLHPEIDRNRSRGHSKR